MDDPYVREAGSVETSDGIISVGADHGKVAVYIGGWLSADGVRLDLPRAEEFARLYVTASLEAERYPAAQDEDGCVSGARPSSGPGPDAARDQAAEGGGGPPSAATLEALARDMLASFIKTSDGHRARVGQVQIAKWTAQLEGRGRA